MTKDYRKTIYPFSLSKSSSAANSMEAGDKYTNNSDFINKWKVIQTCTMLS